MKDNNEVPFKPFGTRWYESIKKTYNKKAVIQDLLKPSLQKNIKQKETILAQAKRIEELEEMEYRYCLVLDHATHSRMSKSNYEVATVTATIDEVQQASNYSTIKDDLTEILAVVGEGTITDIKEYVESLNS